MTIFLGADHRGFELKERIKAWLQEQGYGVEDIGAHALNSDDDYPDFALAVAEKVAQNPQGHRGLLLCGSGVGISVAANKIKGVRASLIPSPEIARMARNDEDINVMSLSGDFTDFETAKKIIGVFLETPFSAEERHQRRVGKIAQYEHS